MHNDAGIILSWENVQNLLFRASEVVFFEKQLVEGFLCDSHHSQTTMVGKSESFNELFKNSAASQFCREFTSKNAKKLDFVNGDCIEEDGYEEDATNACPQFSKTFFGKWVENPFPQQSGSG